MSTPADSPPQLEPGPLVSVVIPTYERRQAVTEAVTSALAQTHRPLEVVVIDDGSTDGTTEHLHARFAGEPRLRVVRQENAGVARARNRAVQEATGEWVLFLDSDDRLLPRCVESQLACVSRHPDARLVIADVALEGDWPGGAASYFAIPGWRFPSDMDAMLRGAYMPPTGMLMHRELALEFPCDPTLPLFDDTDMLLRLHDVGTKVVRNDEICSVYTQHETVGGGQQLTADGNLNTLVRHHVLQRYAHRMKDPARAKHKLDRAIARYLAGRGCYRLARPFVGRWLRRRPTNLRAWAWWFKGRFGKGGPGLESIPEKPRRILEQAGVA